MSYTNGLDKPTDYFDISTWTATTSAISNLDFSPDWVWIKSTDSANGHILFDTIRGANKRLSSASTGAESTRTDELMSFDSNGYTLGSSGNTNDTSPFNASYVGWCWKTGTSVSGTTTGSGTSKAYSGSVSTDAGFSIIKYIGNGTAGHQIPHHLNAVPKMLILKNVTGGDEIWFVYHASLGNTKDIHLNTTGASATADSWNNTTPSTTTWTMSDQSAINSTDGNDHIAYCFAEKKGYSKFGSYTGNGSTDGTFVYTGFKPAFVMTKQTDGVDWWVINDTKRDTFNASTLGIRPNDTAAASSDEAWTKDILSNGFKHRTTNSGSNGSGNTYIYMAFAENPFVTSTGIPTTAR